MPELTSALRKRSRSVAEHSVHLIKDGRSSCRAAFSSLFDPAILRHRLPTEERAGRRSDGWSCRLQLCLSAQHGGHSARCNPSWQLPQELWLSALPLASEGIRLSAQTRGRLQPCRSWELIKGQKYQRPLQKLQIAEPQPSNTFSDPNLEGNEEFPLQHRQLWLIPAL